MSSLAIDVAVGSMSLGVGRLGGSSVGISAFFFDGSTYCHTSLVLAVSCTIKNHCIQSDGLSRMRLIFDSVEVVILEFEWVRQGPLSVLAENLILTFRAFDLIGRSSVGRGRTLDLIVRSFGN